MGVWIETQIEAHFGVRPKSHPVWVCGLKLINLWINIKDSRSHPVWVCGLKRHRNRWKNQQCKVTPCMGVWIET